MKSRSKKKQNEKVNKRRLFTKKKVALIALVLSLILGMGYGAGVLFYSTNVLKTVVYSDKTTGIKKYSDIESYMTQIINEKEVTIITADSSEKFTVPMKSIEPRYSIDEVTTDLKGQTNTWRWPIELFTKNVLGLNVKMTIDGELLKQRLTDIGLFDNSKRVATSDAEITIDENGVNVRPEKGGTQLNEEVTFQKVKQELDKGVFTIDVSDCIIPPVTSEKDLEKLKQEAQEYINTPVVLKLGATKQTLTPKQKSTLLTIDDKARRVSISKEATVKLLQELNNSYIQSQGGSLAIPTVELGGGIAKVIATADNILSMDVNLEAETIRKAIETKQGIDYAPVVKPNAEGAFMYGNKGANISKKGKHFIEVSISQQKLWIYEGDKVILDADVVTGRESKEKSTPTIQGVFQVLYKQRDTTLRGSTVGYTGDQDYNIKVKYWIPFDSQGYGFHDAEGWRPYAYYGGTYYKTEGSHGCVNMRTKDVKLLFDTVANGTPVWVHE